MDWNSILNTLLITLVTAIVPVITTYLVKFLNAKISEAKTKTDNEIIDVALTSVCDLITTVVTSLSQTVVDTAKKEGKFNAEMGQEILSQAKKTITNAVSKEAKEVIAKLYNMDFDDWLTNKIESTIKENK